MSYCRKPPVGSPIAAVSARTAARTAGSCSRASRSSNDSWASGPQAGSAHRGNDCGEFVLVGVCAGYGHAALGTVSLQPVGGKADCAGGDGFLDNLGHRRGIAFIGPLFGGTSLAHHITTQGAVR